MIALFQYLYLISLLIVLVFVLLLNIGLAGKSVRKSHWKPKASVLVAARNEGHRLPTLLAGLAAQNYPAQLCEFILIDDASTDETGKIIAKWAANDNRFKALHLEEAEIRSVGPKKRALLEGLQISGGEIILTTDADCAVKPGWVSALVASFDTATFAVCGHVRTEKGNSFGARLAAFEGLTNNILNAAVIGGGGALSCIGSNFAYRRSAFLGVGGFDRGGNSMSGDDDLLMQKLRVAGGKIRFCDDPDATVAAPAVEDAHAYWSRKRRHLSAGRKYHPFWIISAVVVYLACLLTVCFTVLKLVGVPVGYDSLIGWGILSSFLLFTFYRGTRRFNEKGWSAWAVPSSILFPVAFVLIHPLTLFPSPSWKGRKAR